MTRNTGKHLGVISQAESLPLIRKAEQPTDANSTDVKVRPVEFSGKYHGNHSGRPYLDINNKRGQWIAAWVSIDNGNDDNSMNVFNPGQMITWSRSGGHEYYITIVNPGGKAFNILASKTLGDNYIDVYDDHFDTDMSYYTICN